MFARIDFQGTVRYRIRSAAQLAGTVTTVTTRRLLKGPRRPGWNWWVEVATELLNRQLRAAFEMNAVQEARSFLDSMVVRSPALSQVTITPLSQQKFKGAWFVGKDAQPQVTVLYLHGGGYSFYPKSYANLIALITLAAQSKTLALDYRLSPEHRFPFQLEDAVHAYRWLLDTVEPENVVVAGDSAGGNLALALLLRAREAKLPLPSLAIALSPATDFTIQPASDDCDWIEPRMLARWAGWFCDSAQNCDALVSPALADLRGLPPIYIQAGGCEVLYDSIRAFAEVARRHGAEVTLDAWEDMNHDFQLFGPDAPQSAEALRRIGEVIGARAAGRQIAGSPASGQAAR
jgi:acetyl esterase/lipase